MVSIVEDEPIVAGKRSSREGRLFTHDDLRSMPDDGRRYEVLDGTLVVSAVPTRVHQRAVFRIARLLDDACPQHLEVLVAPFDVVLAKDSIVQPDALVAQPQEADRQMPGRPARAGHRGDLAEHPAHRPAPEAGAVRACRMPVVLAARPGGGFR